jgi:choline dehydrogenase
VSRALSSGDECDYLVVGAGAAGSIVAARLAEDPSVSVCVLEAGPSDLRPYVHIPAGFTRTLSQAQITWPFETQPTGNTGGRSIAVTQGRVVGGSGSINGMIYNRGQPSDFDHWAQLGNQGWSYQDVLPYFARTERRIGFGEAGVRGRTGKIPVTDMDWIHPLSEAFIAAAVEAGVPRNPDYNGGDQEGVGYFQRTISGGRRVSSAAAFLRPALRGGNLRLLADTRASSIVFEGRRAVGVRHVARRGGPERTITARREVVLCCGTVNTARLLQISGIGPAGLLGRLGVPVVHALAGVGENLIDHYSARLVMRARPGVVTLNELARGPRLGMQILRWALGRPSILAVAPSQVYLFCKSMAGLDQPDLQCVFTPGSYQEGRHYILDDYPGATAGAWQHRPHSRGFVRALSSDAYVDPLIQPNYLDDPIDQQVMVAGMRLVRTLMNAPPLARYLSAETVPGDAVAGDQALLDFCRNHGSTGYHLVGTARMGRPEDPRAVVDDRLRVHGVDRLRVADASIMPMIPSANTYAATMMIAEKAADLIRNRAMPSALEPGPLPAQAPGSEPQDRP